MRKNTSRNNKNYVEDFVVQQLKERLTMHDVAVRYGFNPNRNGCICCPFHKEKTPSLQIKKNSILWHCFGCKCGGDIISFVRRLFSLDFGQAVLKMNEDFGLRLPVNGEVSREDRAAAAAATKERKQKEQALDRIVTARKKIDAALLSEEARLYCNKRDHAPALPGDKFHDLYIEACHKLPYIQFLVMHVTDVVGPTILFETDEDMVAFSLVVDDFIKNIKIDKVIGYG